jgi:hypothetical protein
MHGILPFCCSNVHVDVASHFHAPWRAELSSAAAAPFQVTSQSRGIWPAWKGLSYQASSPQKPLPRCADRPEVSDALPLWSLYGASLIDSPRVIMSMPVTATEHVLPVLSACLYIQLCSEEFTWNRAGLELKETDCGAC